MHPALQILTADDEASETSESNRLMALNSSGIDGRFFNLAFVF